MKFKHKIIKLGNESEYLSLQPRSDKEYDYACKAIVNDLRNKFYIFLDRPYKKEEKINIFFEGSSLFVIKIGFQNKVYFFNKFSENNSEDFRYIFEKCIYWQNIFDLISSLNPSIVLKKNYKGTGNFTKISKMIKDTNLSFERDLEKQLKWQVLNLINLIDVKNNKNKLNENIGEKDFQSFRNQISTNYNSLIECLVIELTQTNLDYQEEKWNEWEVALKDWKDFFIEEKMLDSSEKSNKYFNEFSRLFQSRRIPEDILFDSQYNQILINTVMRILFETSESFGVEIETIIKTFKSTFNVKRKNDVIKMLLNLMIEKNNKM